MGLNHLNRINIKLGPIAYIREEEKKRLRQLL